MDDKQRKRRISFLFKRVQKDLKELAELNELTEFGITVKNQIREASELANKLLEN